eukprot:TRINITY_DN7093_c0_g1_i5.p1 TRINITY_DN7093_c0_g1~~TRINITY_DN7093_c0_g1_i5.p1  ORF type:complete len:354 (+),score=45.55 TRINITY_DN7093_c0_g1_i5:55-1062(+)
MFGGFLSLLYYVTIYPVIFLMYLPYSYPTLAMPIYVASLLSIGLYLLIVAIQNFYCENVPVDLKKKYKADWAIVTGASSGIGKAIVQKLAGQGINVVMAALADDLLDESHKELTDKYPTLKFVKVGVNLADPNFMQDIQRKTEGLDINLVFNNAGFITTGFFAKTSIQRSMANFNCNAGAIIPITHHFLNKILESGRPGLFAYTSSSAGFVPNPLSILYPSTKSFMTFFAASLAAEVKSKGVDVVVVHPSPMATNFFKNSDGLNALEAFKRFAVGPEVIADVVFNSAGRFVIRDQGVITVILRVVTKILDPVLFAQLVCLTAHTTGDYAEFDKRE